VGGILGAAVKLARSIHLVSAFWTLGLAIVIMIDVLGRSLFATPLPGTKEILQNSVVSITFLQLPLAIYSGSQLRTSIFVDAMPPFGKKLLRTFAGILGVALFIGLVLSTWQPFLDAYRIGEYEGEGALRVPTWPVRGAVLVTSVFGIFAYLAMIILDWQDKLNVDLSAPGSFLDQGAD